VETSAETVDNNSVRVFPDAHRTGSDSPRGADADIRDGSARAGSLCTVVSSLIERNRGISDGKRLEGGGRGCGCGLFGAMLLILLESR